jgi:hypothetical protein
LTKSVTVKARSLSGGSWTAVNKATFSVGPVKDSLRITEIMYHPQDVNDPNDPNGEFVELKNIGVDPINLNLVRFSDGVDFTFDDQVLAAGAYTVIVPNISTFEDKYGTGISIAGEYAGRLNNAGEEVVIRDAIGTSILEFDYEDDWYPITDGPGFSLTVLNETNPDPNSWDSKTNWRASVDVNGSPGVDDGSPLHNPDAIIINEVLSHSDGGDPDWVELYNTTGSPINISGWFLSDDKDDLKKFEIQTMPSIPSGWYVVFDQDSHFGDEDNPGCNTAFALSENGESVYLTSGSGGELTGYSEVERFGASETGVSFGRHVTSTAKIEFPSMASTTFNSANSDPNVGPIIITEVMYNPKDDKNAEYVELYNNTSSTVVLYDILGNPWKFTDGGWIDYLFDEDANIPAYSYALLVKEKADFYFEGYPAVPGSVQIFEWGEGNLANGGEKIILGKPGDLDDNNFRQYIVVDKVEYDDVPPWPTQPDGFGQSLNRISFIQYGNDPCNWQNGLPSPGGAFIAAPADSVPPIPDPAVWHYPPIAKSVDSIKMTASAGTDQSGVEYYFEETSGNPGGSDSGWQTSRSYTDTGLQEDTSYTYRVRIRDLSPAQNIGSWSTSLSATTLSTTFWTTLTYDDFESGWGNWNDGGSDSSRYTGGTYAHQGNAAINLQDNTSTSVMTTDNLNLSSYSEVKVDFWYYPVSFDSSSEDFWLQISTNGGSSFSTVEEWNLNDEFVNNNFYSDSVIISGYTLTSNIQLRFRCDATGNEDDVYIDEVEISVK